MDRVGFEPTTSATMPTKKLDGCINDKREVAASNPHSPSALFDLFQSFFIATSAES
jgi:hypothetical protein